MNQVQITGRLTSEPTYRDGNTPSVNFTVAVQRNFKNKNGEYDADFIRCSAFGQRAETITQYFHKGNWIGLTGSWRTGSYTDKQGNKVYTNDLSVSGFEFGPSNKKNGNQPSNQQPQEQQNIDLSDDELPF